MEVIRITEELLSYLDKHDKITGNIHSVFEGAFNILDENNRLIGVLSSKKDLRSIQFTSQYRFFWS